MSLVAFLRGVNVGGHKTFQPNAFAQKLRGLDVESIGAAGTFIIRGKVSERTARTTFLKHLPFDTRIMICTARELGDLVRQAPFDGVAPTGDVKRYVTVLEHRTRQLPRLPIYAPDGKDWQVAVIAITGCLALSLHRRAGRALLYPNEVLERQFGVAGTSRNWNTILKLHDRLEDDP